MENNVTNIQGADNEMPQSWPEKLRSLKVGGSITIPENEVRAVRSAKTRVEKASENDEVPMEFSIRTNRKTGTTQAWRLK